MHFQVPATVKKKGKWFISCCPVLDVYSQGETKRKALNNLIEALSLFLVSCFERGTLDKIMKECGFKPIEKRITKVKPLPLGYESIDIPLPFMIPNKRDSRRCHA